MAICEKWRALGLGRDNGISNEWGRYDEMAWAVGFAGVGLGSRCDRGARVEPIGALLSVPQREPSGHPVLWDCRRRSIVQYGVWAGAAVLGLELAGWGTNHDRA
jgi:hypothetical protein